MHSLDALPLAASASNLLAAREQMAFTLGFHIVLSCLGVALPATILVANYLGLKRGDDDAMELARRWSKAMAVTFAVGAVTGTVLTFEFGLLWPRFMDRFGAAFGIAFAIEGIFFFLEAIFLAIYIYGWKRLCRLGPLLVGVPMVITGIGRRLLRGRRQRLDEPAAGLHPRCRRQGRRHRTARRSSSTRRPATRSPHMILAAYIVVGFLVASIYATGMLKGRRDRLPPARPADPVDDRPDRRAAPVPRRRHRRPRRRRQPAGQVRRDGVHPEDRHPPDRVHRRHLHLAAGSRPRSRSPTSTPSWSASAPTPR